MAVRISRLKEGDVAQFSKLAKDIIGNVPYYSSEARRAEAGKFDPGSVRIKLRNRNYLFLVAKDGKTVVGFYYGYYNYGTFFLDWLGVKRDSRREGVADKLSSYAERYLVKRGVHKLWLDTRTANKEAIAFFSKMGYSRIATLRRHWYKQDFYIWHKFLLNK